MGTLAAPLLVSVWHIYGDVCQDWLPADRGQADDEERRPA
jgi:hypothetical protein